ncbi:uncharacterized protein LY79DRAFT_284355 [Colletotrichum navitas]|uniref:Uncharacterized protein n=1 Tax=Colletotrichum navitas TaxID=681940 RepID=A0AAD8Q9A6_9PEZI|nr:uncharacterized protein LY79DRAFT_284355 [Colletotrichum navitas]KAK1598260.1 hypothetical protein LY79DRAFT_284355 [Colletotrichum navitas]
MPEKCGRRGRPRVRRGGTAWRGLLVCTSGRLYGRGTAQLLQRTRSPRGCHCPFLCSFFSPSDSPSGAARVPARKADCHVTAWPYFGNLFIFIFNLFLAISPVRLAMFKSLLSFFLSYLRCTIWGGMSDFVMTKAPRKGCFFIPTASDSSVWSRNLARRWPNGERTGERDPGREIWFDM